MNNIDRKDINDTLDEILAILFATSRDLELAERRIEVLEEKLGEK
jgi:hypothetical protein